MLNVLPVFHTTTYSLRNPQNHPDDIIRLFICPVISTGTDTATKIMWRQIHPLKYFSANFCAKPEIKLLELKTEGHYN